MRWYHWVLIAAIVLFVADGLIGWYLAWRERRDLTIRDRDMRKWGLRSFDQGKEKRL